MLRETPYSNIPNQIPSKKIEKQFLFTWSNLIGKLLNIKTFTQFLQKMGEINSKFTRVKELQTSVKLDLVSQILQNAIKTTLLLLFRITYLKP